MNLSTLNFRTLGTRNWLIAAIATLCIGGTGSVCLAGESTASQSAPKKVVQFGDLNLTHSAGVEALYGRIVAAAREVCEQPNSRSLQAQAQARLCLAKSTQRAVEAVQNPGLTAMYIAKTGHTLSPPAVLAARQ